MIHLVVSDQEHYTFLYRYAKYNRKDGQNEQTRTWVSSKCKNREVYVTLLCSSPCICRLSRACILCETSTMLTHILTALLPSSHCLHLLTVSFSGQLSRADCSLLPFFANSFHYLPWDLPSLFHFWSHGRSHSQALCVGYALKQIMRFSDRRQHERKWMLPLVSQEFWFLQSTSHINWPCVIFWSHWELTRYLNIQVFNIAILNYLWMITQLKK